MLKKSKESLNNAVDAATENLDSVKNAAISSVTETDAAKAITKDLTAAADAVSSASDAISEKSKEVTDSVMDAKAVLSTTIDNVTKSHPKN